jgi:hypothetical protein
VGNGHTNYGGFQRDSFLDHAAGILDTASACPGQQDWTILVGAGGQLEMLAENDWPLDSLARERGAKMAFRVQRAGNGVQVEGRQGVRSCLFASEPAGAAMQRALNGPGLYRVLA